MNFTKRHNGAVSHFFETAPVIFVFLLSDAKLCNAGTVTLDVLVHEVVEQTAALTDHF